MVVPGRKHPPFNNNLDSAVTVNSRFPMTISGFEALKSELEKLRSVERPEVIQSIAAAREHGDLSENAEYQAARERQSFIEGRVAELEDKISRAQVIDVSTLSGKSVKFGATVVLADEDADERSTYKIVGTDESDINSGLLSITSPLAIALLGKTKGDSVEVTTPGGAKSYEIISVKFA